MTCDNALLYRLQSHEVGLMYRFWLAIDFLKKLFPLFRLYTYLIQRFTVQFQFCSVDSIPIHSVVAPSGELRGKGMCDVFAGKTEHLSALEERFSRRGAIQIYVYLYLYLPIHDDLEVKVTLSSVALRLNDTRRTELLLFTGASHSKLSATRVPPTTDHWKPPPSASPPSSSSSSSRICIAPIKDRRTWVLR